MKRVTWSEAATRDLRRMRDDLSQLDPAVGQGVVRRMILAARWLLDTPGAGPMVGYRHWRKWRPVNTPYMLIYQLTKNGVTVVRGFHAQQDWRAVVD